ILKVAGIRQLLSDKNRKNIKASGEKRIVFLHLLHFRDLSDSPFLFPKYGNKSTPPYTAPLKKSRLCHNI
ncbi:MAG: hypothetical protein C6W58_16130, partial [Bacillaceae bacterium]